MPNGEHFIQRTYTTACEMFCKPTLWEIGPIDLCNWDYTGNWKYIEQMHN